MKKYASLILALLLCFAVLATGCGTTATPTATEAPSAENTATEAPEAAIEPIVIQVGFENNMDEPTGLGVQKWAELVEEQSGGTIVLELFPNSSLGDKTTLVDQILMGEPILTCVDGSFYADYGVPDLGIVCGPFFFESWDDVWALTESEWYKEQCDTLAANGLTVIGSNWKYGERELMTKTKVVTPSDLTGMKIRLANSQIYVEGFNALGATAVPMALSDVYTALQNNTLEGVENPLGTLYGQSFQEVCKYVLMTGHIKNFTTWCGSTAFFETLTDEQIALLSSTCVEAGLTNNEALEATIADYAAKLEEAGVEITYLTDEQIAEWKAAGESFYDLGPTFGWSEGLYETTQAAMGK